MPRPRMPLKEPENLKKISALLKNKSLEVWKRERLFALLLGLSSDQEISEIAQEVGCSESSILRWFKKYNATGLDSLLKKGRGNGPQRSLTEDLEYLLRQKWEKGDFSSAKEAQIWLKEDHATSLALPTVYKYLK